VAGTEAVTTERPFQDSPPSSSGAELFGSGFWLCWIVLQRQTRVELPENCVRQA